ncbi:hypothetical protein TeGR_g12845 [Tetraparma gracilis]|uniref:Glycerol-3-phosphate dehydrogenase [NAD(+)] n=1 Tax=Tetraparma gracilis TaxID=2962635 RepID=A0ABQ6MGW6_9STRA|nr:hypothetical protein TeGR_g12845 [Tetraparma gracilis]
MYVHDELVAGAGSDEVLAAWKTVQPFLSEDARQGGVLDATSIQLIAAEVGVAVSRKEAQQALVEMDANQDGKADKEEFLQWWMDSGKSTVGRLLTSVINKAGQNTKYLPGISLGDNVHAVPDLLQAAEKADMLVFVTPHQFIPGVLGKLKGKIKPNARAISLVKGMEITPDGFNLISKVIERELDIKCSVLMGANIAQEIAEGRFSECTVGAETTADREAWLRLFNTPLFQTRGTSDVPAVEMCGTLKNVVAIGAGFIDGLEEGNNAKAAIMRVGFSEMIKLIKRAYPETSDATFLESCGIADLITTCYGGRNRKCAEAFVQRGGKATFDDIEEELLAGQKLQGVLTSNEVQELIESWGDGAEKEFPLMVTINRIIRGDIPPGDIVRYAEMPSKEDYADEGRRVVLRKQGSTS